MKLYHTTFEEDLQIMQTYNITAEELFIIKLLFLAQEDNGRETYILDYFLKCKHSKLPLEILRSFVDKNILLSNGIPNAGDKFVADNIRFTNQFLKDWFLYSHAAGKELMEKYPNYMVMYNGELLPAKNITKTYSSLEAMFASYSKAIRHSKKLHEKVMFLLEWAKENNLIKYGIAEFVASRKWESLAQDYEQNASGNFRDTYDNKHLI